MSSKKQLCVEVSSDFCTIYESQASELTLIAELVFTEKKDYQIKESLATLFKEKLTNLAEFDEMSVSWISEKAILIPSAIFEPKEIGTLFGTCFQKQEQGTELDYNRISELSIVNVYEIPLWLKSFFVLRFPRVVINHEYSMNLRGMMKQAFKLHVNLQVYNAFCSIQIVEKNDVLFCNSFEIQHENDVIYYLSFVLKQLNLDEQEGFLNVHVHQHAVITKQSLKDNLLKINLFKSLDIEFNSNKIIKFQQFCV